MLVLEIFKMKKIEIIFFVILILVILWGIQWMGEFKHEVRQFQKPYDNQQAEQISLMV